MYVSSRFRLPVLLGLLWLWGGWAELRAQDSAGEILTPERCVELVVENNLTLRQQQDAIRIAAANHQQAKLAYLPSLNGSIDFRRNFGTTFDAFSFSRVSQTTDFSSPLLVTSIDIFSGFARYYALQQNYWRLKAQKAALNRLQNELIMQVLNLYLQIIIDRNNLAQVEDRIELLSQQKQRVDGLYEAGLTVRSEPLNLQSQLASEEVNRIALENTVKRNRLTLLQLLQLDLNGDYTFEVPSLENKDLGSAPLPPLEDIEAYALKHMPEIREQEHLSEVRQYETRQAQAALMPTLSLRAGLASNYTSNGGQLEFDTETIDLGNGVEFPVRTNTRRVRTGYFEQLEDNFSQFLTLSLNVPIFNGMQARTNRQIAEINAHTQGLNQKQVADQLIRDIQQAYLASEAALETYNATKQQLAAVQEAFSYAEVQYEAGTLHFYDYLETLNNKTRVETELLKARYDYLFKRKLLDVYYGKPIKF